MKEMDNIKEELLQWTFENFCKTRKCNGLNSESIRYNYSDEDMQKVIVELLEEDSISLIADEHDINYSINRNGFVPKDQQITYVKKNGVDGNFCIYPSKEYLMQHYAELDLIPRYPFNKLLKIGTPHNRIMFFEWGVLFKYYSDPRYDFEFSDYTGHIFSSEKLIEERRFTIKTFGVGKNKNGEHVVAVPLSELVNMPSACQIEWYSMLEAEQENCAVLNNYKDVLNGCWKFEDTLFRTILKELSNINKLTTAIWECPFYRKEYIEDKPIGFDLLYLPTKKAYLDYVSLLEKIVIHNINEKFFDSIGVNRKNENGTVKGSLNCLKEWLLKVNKDSIEDIHSALSNLRKIRDPQAHEVYNDEYDLEYFNKQDVLSKDVFKALYSLRKLIQTHPNAKGVEIPYIDSDHYLII